MFSLSGLQEKQFFAVDRTSAVMTSGVGGDVTSLIPSNPEWNYCCLEKNLLLPSVYPHCNGRHRCECDKMERHERKKGTCTMRWLSFRYSIIPYMFKVFCTCVRVCVGMQLIGLKCWCISLCLAQRVTTPCAVCWLFKKKSQHHRTISVCRVKRNQCWQQKFLLNQVLVNNNSCVNIAEQQCFYSKHIHTSLIRR